MLKDNRLRYFEKLKRNHKTLIKIAFLYPDETIQKEITNEIYQISGNLNVNYQNGARRTCTITINNDKFAFPLNWDGNFWIGQKFQLWTGLYLDDEEREPYYISQGIFYILNPSEAYNPTTHTISLQGVDKWAYLDGRLFGYLNGTYVASQAGNEEATIKALVKGLLNNDKYANDLSETPDILKKIDCKEPVFDGFQETIEMVKYTTNTGRLVYTYEKVKDGKKQTYYCTFKDTLIPGATSDDDKVNRIYYSATPNNASATGYDIIFTEDKDDEGNSKPVTPTTTVTLFTTIVNAFTPPYTVNMEVGKTLADIILEYNTMLMGQVYYDTLGHLHFEAASTSLANFSNLDREVAWHFTVTEQEFLGLTLENKFDGVFNDVIVLGAVTNGKQAKARIQNRDNNSDFSIDKIGLKTKTPYQSDQYYSDEQCLALAQHYAQADMALEKAGSFSTLPIYHLDVGQIVTLSTPGNHMSKEAYLVTGFSYDFSGTMNINVTNMRYFSNWSIYKAYTVTYKYIYIRQAYYEEITLKNTFAETVEKDTYKFFNDTTAPSIENYIFSHTSVDNLLDKNGGMTVNGDMTVIYYYKGEWQ